MSKNQIRRENAFLKNKLNNLQDEIQRMKRQLMHGDPGPAMDNSFEEENEVVIDDDGEEPLSNLNKILMATEELIDVKCKKYVWQNLRENGAYKEVVIELHFREQLQVSITYIENIQCPDEPLQSLKWIIFEDQVANKELEPLKELISNDLSSLLLILKQYTELSSERASILFDVVDRYRPSCEIITKDIGVVLKWRNLFEIVWNLKVCEHSRQVINSIDILFSEDRKSFIDIIQEKVEELIDTYLPTPQRRIVLLEICESAAMYH